MLILLSVFADIALLAFILMLPPPSTAGAAYLRRLRETRESSRSLVAPGAAVAMLAGEAVLLGVALEGFGGVQDEATRAALLAGIPSSSGGGGGGGGCSGGCGGGGCGGGCGG